jgi:hypothetical protein
MTRRRAAPPLPKQKRDGSRTWRTKPLLDQVAWFETAAADLAEDCEHVIRRAVLDHDDGTSGGTDVKVSGGRVADDGSENGRTPSMVLRRMENGDEVSEAVARLVGRVIAMREAMHGALADAAFLRGLDPEKARRLVEDQKIAPGAGWCEDCGRWVLGGRDDRLRSGRCDKCRKRNERGWDGLERLVDESGIAARIYQPAPPPSFNGAGIRIVTTLNRCATTKWSHGIVVQCTLDQDHEGDHAWPE